jgi:hypothetical protein
MNLESKSLWPDEVTAVITAIDANHELVWAYNERVSQPDTGTAYGFNIEATARTFARAVHEENPDTTRLMMENDEERANQGDIWVGRIGECIVDIRMDMPASATESSASVTIILPVNRWTATRVLDERAADAIDTWIKNYGLMFRQELPSLTPERLGAQFPLLFADCEPEVYRRLLTALSAACQQALAKL